MFLSPPPPTSHVKICHPLTSSAQFLTLASSPSTPFPGASLVHPLGSLLPDCSPPASNLFSTCRQNNLYNLCHQSVFHFHLKTLWDLPNVIGLSYALSMTSFISLSAATPGTQPAPGSDTPPSLGCPGSVLPLTKTLPLYVFLYYGSQFIAHNVLHFFF